MFSLYHWIVSKLNLVNTNLLGAKYELQVEENEDKQLENLDKPLPYSFDIS